MPASVTNANFHHLPAPQRRRLLGSCLAVGALVSTRVWGELPQTLKLTRIGDGPELAHMEAALTTAYGWLGVTIEFVDMPGERALVESNSGRVDGETARIAGMESRYPALRRVDVPLYINTNSIFVYGNGKPVPTSLSQLSKLGSVGIIRGWKASEDAVAGWNNVERVNSYHSALRMLKFGRLDAFLGRGEDTLLALQKENLSGGDFPSKVVLRFPLFHYLHQKHEALLPVITRELIKLKGAKDAVVATKVPFS